MHSGTTPDTGELQIPSANGVGKIRLLTREHLDGRTAAVREFDSIAEGITSDLGGASNLSTVQRHLVEAFAGAAVHVNHLNTCLLLGQQVNILEHSTAISTMVRIASRIGIHRVARNIGPTLGDLLRADQEEQRRQQQEDAPP
jgi:hypothetical protein